MGVRLFRVKGSAGKVLDHRITFKLKGPFRWEPSFAVIEPELGCEAYGVVAALTEAEWRSITAHEKPYHLECVEVLTEAGVSICYSLFSRKCCYSQDMIPSSRYARLLYLAATYHRLPDVVIERYAALMEQGVKMTRYTKWSAPVTKKLVLYMPVKLAICFGFFGVPVLIVLLIIFILSYLY